MTSGTPDPLTSAPAIIGPRSTAAARALPLLACGVFLLYAFTFLYFFVDDEAIPFVYARNLLHGHGIVYSPDIDGRVEGFSDLLHVIVSAVIYAATRALHLPTLSVFAVGKAISLACGAATIVVAWNMLRRASATAPASTTAALLSLALAGPLAVWSCSSLETVPFALGFAGLCLALMGQPRDRLAATLAVVLVLDRADGFVWVLAVGAAFAIFGSPAQRQTVRRRVLVPALVAAIAVEAFRLLYYQDWLPLPVFAKVVFKLHNNGQLVQKVPEFGYLRRFTQVYGWVPAAALAVAAVLSRKRRDARALTATIVLLCVYVNVIGDWMFGFRFVVPLLAPAAVLIGCGIATLHSRSRVLAFAAAAVVVMASVVGAARFVTAYVHQPNEFPRENFWRAHSFETRRFFQPYYELIETLQPLAPPGTLVAYNQAGLIPFALDLPNVDDLGICSRYFAELPATDVAYTEVGRYEPLTNDPIVTARRAYMLNRGVRFVIGRADLLKRANLDGIPPALFGGYYALRAIDATGQNAVYERTPRSADEYRRGPDLFLQSLTHVSRLKGAAIDGKPIAPSEMLRQLPYLVERGGMVPVTGRFALEARFSVRDVDARHFYIEIVRTSRPMEMHIALLSSSGRVVYQWLQPIGTDFQSVDKWFDTPVYASTMVLIIDGPATVRVPVFLHDVRLMGQTPELRQFVKSQVRFTAK